ncbi:hypothetical protein DL768_007691 [Monosporascus sp. mg162]|nr:hypothetical protein DL768_007691 [Monosporascus sp. mg162]
MNSYLCSCCEGIITGPQILGEERPHHSSALDLIKAAEDGCYICGIIVRSVAWKSLDSSVGFKPTWYLASMSGRQAGWFKLTIDAAPSEEELYAELLGDRDNEGSETQATEDEQHEFELVEPLWGFYLQPIADVEERIAKSEPPPGLHSPELLELVRTWFSGCSKNHTSCRASLPDFLPTRLLEIISYDQARIVITQEVDDAISSYASLSHCWGKSKRLKLETSNIDKLRTTISIGELPATYREAIALCIALGLHHIWIDSLCIIQDSREDWRREALTMKDVYQNSALNIAAAASAESSEPSFSLRDTRTIRPLQTVTRWNDQESRKYFLADAAMYEDEVERAPLRQRAWVIQEIWLAPCNLFLTKNQLWWECCELEACEAYPRGIPEAWLSADWLESVQTKSSTKNRETRWGKLSHVYSRWDALVETYASCKLTFPSDRMIAFAGILQDFQDVIPGDACLAGHWRSRLPQSLVWTSRRGQWSFRPAAYRAPSWSWASIEGRVTFGYTRPFAEGGVVETVCKLMDVQIVSESPTGEGDLKGGWVKLSGHLTRVGCIKGQLTVERDDGSFDFIEGSTDNFSGQLFENNWTNVEFDESTKSGEPAMSFIDGLTSHTLSNGEFEGCERTSISGDVLGKDLYSLPIIKWQQGRPCSAGLVLCETVVEGQRVFQRTGGFQLFGPVTVAKIMESPRQEVLII